MIMVQNPSNYVEPHGRDAMSRLFFLFAIEPLALGICQSLENTGITIGETEHYLAVFVDAVVLFLANLDISIGSLNKPLKTF